MTTIREQLEESQAIGSRAKPGPWYANDRGIGYEVGASPVVPDSTEWPEAINDGFRETFSESDATFIAHARTELPLRNAQLAAVLKVHEPFDALNVNARNHHKVQVCTGCGQDDGNWNQWPCPTIRAIEDAAP